MILRFLEIHYLKYYLLGCYLIIAPFLIIPDVGMYDSKKILQLFLFLLLFLSFFLIISQSNNQRIRLNLSKNIAILGCLLFGMGIVSSLFSDFPQDAFIEIMMLGIIITTSVLLSERSLIMHYHLGKFIYITALVFSSFYLIYFLGNYIASHLNPLVPLWPDRLAVAIRIEDTLHRGEEVLNFVHKRFFNHIQTWTLPLIISAAVYFKNNKPYRNLILGLLVFWWCLVFASGARGTITAFVLACLLLLFLFRNRSYAYLSFAGIGALGGMVFYWLLFKVIVPGKSLPVARMSDSGRWEMWEKALEMWWSNPILGAGPMHYAVINGEPYFAHPHNFYLQLLAEWGILAFICFIILVVSYLLFFRKHFLINGMKIRSMGSPNTTVYIGMLGSLFGGFLHAGVSGVLHTPMSQIWAVLIISWFLSLWNRYNDSNSVFKLSKKYVAIFYMVLVAELLYCASPYLSKLDNEHVEYRSDFEDAKLYPRFWEQGLIYGEQKRDRKTEEGRPDQIDRDFED